MNSLETCFDTFKVHEVPIMKSHLCRFCWSLLLLVKQHETGKSKGRLIAATHKPLTGHTTAQV